MALQISEGTRQDTLDKLKLLTHAPFPVGYVKIESWRVVPIDPSYQCVLALYFDKQTRDENPLSAVHYEIGSTIQQSDFDAMTQGDDRQLLYKQVEYIIHYQLHERAVSESDNPEQAKAAANAELQQLATDLSIDTLFLFPAETDTEA